MLPQSLCLLVAVLSGSPSQVWGLSCTADAFSGSRIDAIRETFCWNDDVYFGKVIGATCNCFPDESTVSARCQRYELDEANSIISTSVLSLGTCDTRIFVQLESCSTLGNSLVSWGLRVEGPSEPGDNTPTQNLTNGLSCNLSCTFNSLISDGDLQPCIYTVKVGEVFKGNYSTGDVIEVVGPNVVIAGSNEGRVLQVNTDYLAGIGGLCNQINEWSLASTFSENEVKVLRQNITCGQYASLPSMVTVVLAMVPLVLLS